MTKISKKKLRHLMSRRRVLAGAGAALTLPFLPAIHGGSVDAQGDTQRRLLIFFVPEGVNQGTWFPSGGGVSEGLMPLADRRHQFATIRGLNNQAGADMTAGRDDLHSTGIQCALTGGDGPGRTINGVDIPGGQSIDQIIARTVGAGAAIPSYELGVRSNCWPDCGVGPDRGQVSFSRWRSPRNAKMNPVEAYGDLVAPSVGMAMPMQTGPSQRLLDLQDQKSVLDAMLPELAQLRCELDLDGRLKLESHIDGVREIEQRLQRAITQEQDMGSTTPSTLEPPMVDSAWGSEGYYRNGRNSEFLAPAQCQIAAYALATGITQAITIQIGHSVNTQSYPWIPGMNFPNLGHHAISHPGTTGIDRGRALEDQTKINAWIAEQIDLTLGWLERYDALDNTLVLLCSDMSSGFHTADNMPFLLAGMGDKFQLGRDYDAGGQTHNALLVALLQGFGLDVGAIGPDRYNNSSFSDILI